MIFAIFYFLFFYFLALMVFKKTVANYISKSNSEFTDITIVIAFKNEESNLFDLLFSLKNLSKQPREIIFVNDHSTDNSLAMLRHLLDTLKINNISILESKGLGKKAALSMGINSAKTTYIAVTDADCILPKFWLNNIDSHILKYQPNLLFGLVDYIKNNHWVSMYQKIESRALINTGLGMFYQKKPIMCNGANMVFKKEFWQSIGGYSSHESLASGDDIFLLHQFYQVAPNKVVFLNAEPVLTKAPNNVYTFLKQRKRWASKTGHYIFWWANFFPFLLLFNLIGMLSMVFYYCFNENYGCAVFILVLKIVSDYFIINCNQQFNDKISIFGIFKMQIWQILYPLFIPFVSNKWK